MLNRKMIMVEVKDEMIESKLIIKPLCGVNLKAATKKELVKFMASWLEVQLNLMPVTP